MEVIGIHSGFQGLLTKDIESFTDKSLSVLLNQGGTMLGTSREKPFKKGGVVSDVDKPALILQNIQEMGLACVCLLYTSTAENMYVVDIELPDGMRTNYGKDCLLYTSSNEELKVHRVPVTIIPFYHDKDRKEYDSEKDYYLDIGILASICKESHLTFENEKYRACLLYTSRCV